MMLGLLGLPVEELALGSDTGEARLRIDLDEVRHPLAIEHEVEPDLGQGARVARLQMFGEPVRDPADLVLDGPPLCFAQRRHEEFPGDANRPSLEYVR